jgi:hypothetical protein
LHFRAQFIDPRTASPGPCIAKGYSGAAMMHASDHQANIIGTAGPDAFGDGNLVGTLLSASGAVTSASGTR